MNNSKTDTYFNVLGQLNLDDIHIKQAFDYYHQRYVSSDEAKQFVLSSCLIHDSADESHYLGYVDRTLGKHIPKTKTPEGAAIRGSLMRCGLIRATGHELFRGCVVIPTSDDNGNIISVVGYRVGRLRQGDRSVVYWGKPTPTAFVDSGMSFARELVHGQAYH